MSDTPRTDAVCVTPIMGVTVTNHKWDELQKLARTMERELATARAAFGNIRTMIDGRIDTVNWISTDERLPDDEQRVLAAWTGPSCVEGMETLIYVAADEPDGPDGWRDVHGEGRDRPTHWTLLEMPK